VQKRHVACMNALSLVVLLLPICCIILLVIGAAELLAFCLCEYHDRAIIIIYYKNRTRSTNMA